MSRPLCEEPNHYTYFGASSKLTYMHKIVANARMHARYVGVVSNFLLEGLMSLSTEERRLREFFDFLFRAEGVGNPIMPLLCILKSIRLGI